MKKYIIGAVVGALLMFSGQSLAETVSQIGKKVDGEAQVRLDGNTVGTAVIIEGKSYAPVRDVAEAVGLQVGFKSGYIDLSNVDDTATKISIIQTQINSLQSELDQYKNSLSVHQDQLKQYQDKYATLTIPGDKQFYQQLIDKEQGYIDDSNKKIAEIQAQIDDLNSQIAELQAAG